MILHPLHRSFHPLYQTPTKGIVLGIVVNKKCAVLVFVELSG